MLQGVSKLMSDSELRHCGFYRVFLDLPMLFGILVWDTKACLSTGHVLVSHTNEPKSMEGHKKTLQESQALNSLSGIFFRRPELSSFFKRT